MRVIEGKKRDGQQRQLIVLASVQRSQSHRLLVVEEEDEVSSVSVLAAVASESADYWSPLTT